MCLRGKLSLFGAIVAFVLLTCFSIFFYRSEERRMRDQASADMVLRLNVFQASLGADPREPAPAGARGRGGPPPNLPELIHAAIDGSDVVAIIGVENAPPTPIPAGGVDGATAVQLTEAGRFGSPQEIATGDGGWLVYSPVPGPGPRPFVVTLVRPTGAIAAELDLLQNLLIATELAAVALVLANGWWVAGSALGPVHRMTAEARAIADSADFSGRIVMKNRSDELADLAATLNDMLGRLSAAHATQREFLARAAHELRTPLTVVSASLDAARAQATAPDNRAQALDLAAAESARMSRLVSDLMEIARNDAGQDLLVRPFSLDAVVMRVYQAARTVTADVRLELGEWDQVEIRGDSDRIQQTLTNLVDNALRYTPAGGAVTIDLKRRGEMAVVVVRDTGQGIEARHLPYIFDRFYRASGEQASREGSGLGLAIVRDIVVAHGGELTVSSTPGQGSAFEVAFPIAGADGTL